MSDGDNDADKTHGRVNEKVVFPEIRVSTYIPQATFKVVEETKEHYIFKREDETLGAVEKDKVRVVVISGYIR